MEGLPFWVWLLATLVVGILAHVIANQMNSPIGRALDHVSTPIRNWRLRRAKRNDALVETLKSDNKNLIAFCAYRSMVIVLYTVVAVAAITLTILFGHWLHVGSQDNTASAAEIAWNCIASASCRNTPTSVRLYEYSEAYFTDSLLAGFSIALFFYNDRQFKFLLKRVTNLVGRDLEP